MPEAAKRSRVFEFALIFAVAYLLSQVIMRFFFPSEEVVLPKAVTMVIADESVRLGEAPSIIVTNGTDTAFTFTDRCPAPPVEVFTVQGAAVSPIPAIDYTAAPCERLEPLPASESRTITLAPWKQYIFAQKATYELRLPEAGSGAVARVEMGEPGMLVKLYRAFITKPFLNFLVLVASVLPNHNLGISIIILTLVVKLLLFLPTQRALEGQKKMQLLQPKLEVLKKEHSGDPQKLHEETVKIWKEHGVNPFQSCLPLLIQFPILIGLFHVIRDGVDLELSQHLLYESFRHLEWSFGTNFLGFDLTKAYPFVFPPILVVLQFVQMKLSFMIAGKKKKQAAQGKEESSEKKDEMQKAQDVQQKIMTYALPLMIGFFAWKLPSAVSLYWGISTLFAIGQQMIVNREHLKV